MPPATKENVRKRVGPLSKRLYDLFVRLLKCGQMATISELQQAHFKFASPTRLAKLVKIQKSTIRRHGRRKAPYQKANILAQDAEGYVIDRFKTWASRMRLNGQEQLVYAATQKVILPKDEFPKVVMSLHDKGDNSSGKHRSFMKTLQLVKNTYSIGRRQFGISEFAIRKIVSSCPAEKCNSRLPDQGCHPGERLHLDSDESAGSSPSSDDQHTQSNCSVPALPPPPPAHTGQEVTSNATSGVIDLTIQEPLKKRLKRLASLDPNLNGQAVDSSATPPVSHTRPLALKMLPLYTPTTRQGQSSSLMSTAASDQPLNLTTTSGSHTASSSPSTVPMYLMVPIRSLDNTLGGGRVATLSMTQSALCSGGELTKLLLAPSQAQQYPPISSSSSIQTLPKPVMSATYVPRPSFVSTATPTKGSHVGYVEKWHEFWRLTKLMKPEIRQSYLLENRSTDRLNRMIVMAHDSVRQCQRLLKDTIENGPAAT